MEPRDERRKYKLLVVDDEPDQLEYIARVFRGKFEVVAATSGEQGLALLRQHPDTAIIISDHRMPGMLGSEFLAQSYQLRPGCMRVLMTGYADLESVVDSINRAKVWNYVAKPVAGEQLTSVVSSALEVYQLRRRNEQLMKELEEKNARLQDYKRQLESSLVKQTDQFMRTDMMVQELAQRFALPGFYEPAGIEPQRPMRVTLNLPVRVHVIRPSARELLPGTLGWEWLPVHGERAGLRLDGHLRELSETAARVALDEPVPMLSRVVLVFNLARVSRAVVFGVVVGRSPQAAAEAGIAVLFEAMPLRVRQEITALIQSRGTR